MERFKLLQQQNNMAISPDPSVYPILTHNLMLFTCVAALHYFKAIITQQNTLGYISRGLELLFQHKHISSVLRILIFAWSHWILIYILTGLLGWLRIQLLQLFTYFLNCWFSSLSRSYLQIPLFKDQVISFIVFPVARVGWWCFSRPRALVAEHCPLSGGHISIKCLPPICCAPSSISSTENKQTTTTKWYSVFHLKRSLNAQIIKFRFLFLNKNVL